MSDMDSLARQERPSGPAPRVGQVWRERESGRTIRLMPGEVQFWHEDVELDAEGCRWAGYVSITGLYTHYELVADADAD
jgi:hypothetical protein